MFANMTVNRKDKAKYIVSMGIYKTNVISVLGFEMLFSLLCIMGKPVGTEKGTVDSLPVCIMLRTSRENVKLSWLQELLSDFPPTSLDRALQNSSWKCQTSTKITLTWSTSVKYLGINSTARSSNSLEFLRAFYEFKEKLFFLWMKHLTD